MTYTVKELATISGVSGRTLHLYDKIGLLKPYAKGANNYRYYEEPELLRLQQILFFKELEFSLDEIQKLLSQSDFDNIKALNAQKKLLQDEILRKKNLIDTIDKTIKHLEGKYLIKDEKELYSGFTTKTMHSLRSHYNTNNDQTLHNRLDKAETTPSQALKLQSHEMERELARESTSNLGHVFLERELDLGLDLGLHEGLEGGLLDRGLDRELDLGLDEGLNQALRHAMALTTSPQSSKSDFSHDPKTNSIASNSAAIYSEVSKLIDSSKQPDSEPDVAQVHSIIKQHVEPLLYSSEEEREQNREERGKEIYLSYANLYSNYSKCSDYFEHYDKKLTDFIARTIKDYANKNFK